MLKSSLIGALCILALVAVGSLAAQSYSDTQNQPQEQYLTGTVVSTSSTTLVVRTDAGDQMTFDVDSQSALPSQLQPGTKVDIGYRTDTGGKYHAMEVRTIGSTGATTEPSSAYSGSTATNPSPSSGSVTEPSKTTYGSDYDTDRSHSSMDKTSTYSDKTSSYSSHSKKLPQTASPIALIGLIGVGSLGAALALKALSR